MFSEWIVSTTDTRSLSLVTIYPTAAGDLNEWTVGTYDKIDESTLSDADAIYTNITAKSVQLNMSNLPAGTWTVRGTRLAARCAKSYDASISQVKLGIKSGGVVNVDAGRVITTAPTYTCYDRIMDVNPVTSVAFTQAEIDAMQIAFASLT